jgi:hypothetical protein
MKFLKLFEEFNIILETKITSSLKLTKQHQDEISDLSDEKKKKLADDLDVAVGKVNEIDFTYLPKDKARIAYAKAMKDAKLKVYKKYITI